MQIKVLALAAVMVLGVAPLAHADEYGAGPRPPYASGLYVGLGFGSPDCSFTLAGVQGGITILGISLGGGARLGLGGGCRERLRDDAARAYPPPTYNGGYPAQGGYYGGGSQGGYPSGGYPAPQPCPCQAPMGYRPY